VCDCLHNSQSCVSVSLLIIIHCTHCNASRVVFLMWLLCTYCRFSAVLIVWDAGSTLGWWVFGVTALKGRGGGGFMVGQVLARLRRSY